MYQKTASIITSLLIIISLLLQSSSSLYSLPFSLYLCFSLYLLTKQPKNMPGEQHQHEEENSKYTSLEVETGESSGAAREKTRVMEAPLIGKAARKAGEGAVGATGVKRGVGIIDFLVRLFALAAVLAAATAMGTTQQTLPFFTQFFQFQAKFYDLPTFTYFVIANAIVAAYLVLSLPFSIVTIVRPLAKVPRLVLIIFDTIAMTLTTSAAAGSAAIVYLAHKGNTNTNWIAICQQFGSFCQRTSGAVVASFIAVVLFVLLVILSSVALKSH